MKILVPIDSSAGSHAALPVAKHIARQLRAAHVVLVSVGELPETPELGRDEEQALQDVLREAEADLNGIPVRHRTSKAGDPARGIVEAAREEQADLIVMASHARAGMSMLAQGSVAEEVLRSGVAPVTLVRWPET